MSRQPAKFVEIGTRVRIDYQSLSTDIYTFLLKLKHSNVIATDFSWITRTELVFTLATTYCKCIDFIKYLKQF
jgi:hypothetical protein